MADSISLREHFEILLAEMDRRNMAAFLAQENATQTALSASEKAIEKAEKATSERLHLLNELRSGVATREQFLALEARFGDLKERLDKNEGVGSGKTALWGYAIGAAGLIATIASLYALTSQ